MTRQYDIALSFAGEDRYYVKQVAKILKDSKIKVFYDEFEESNLWGKNLYTYLRDIYRDQAQYTIMFCSENYSKKLWTNHERESAQERAFKESSEYILPAKLDDTEIPGLPNTVVYIDLRLKTPYEFCLIIGEKLDVNILKTDKTEHTQLTAKNVIDQELREIRAILLQSFLRWNRFKWLPSFDNYKQITAYSDELGNELDNQKLAFMLNFALWYGHDVIYWAERNKENNEIIPILLEALQRPERRPFYRTGLAIEYLSPDFRGTVIKHIREQLPDNKEVDTIVNKAEKNETLKFWEEDLPKIYDREKAKQLVGRAKTSKRVNNQAQQFSLWNI